MLKYVFSLKRESQLNNTFWKKGDEIDKSVWADKIISCQKHFFKTR